jgi:hypothetical protein
MALARLAVTDPMTDEATGHRLRDSVISAPLRRDEVYDPISDTTITIWSDIAWSIPPRRE